MESQAKLMMGMRSYNSITTDDKLLDNIWHKLCELSPLRPHDIMKLNQGDKRVDSKTYTSEDKYPGIFNRLLEFCDDYYEGDTDKFIINYRVGMKLGRNTIDPPADKCAARIVFNFHNAEIYCLEAATDESSLDISDIVSRKSKVDDIPTDRELYLPANTVVHLGPKQLANYTIRVKSPPPEYIPTTMSMGDSRRTAPTKFMRPNKYHRITVVIDILDDNADHDKIKNIVNKNINKMTMADMQKISSSVTQGKEMGEVNLGPIGKKEKKKIKRQMVAGNVDAKNEKTSPNGNNDESLASMTKEERINMLMKGDKNSASEKGVIEKDGGEEKIASPNIDRNINNNNTEQENDNI